MLQINLHSRRKRRLAKPTARQLRDLRSRNAKASQKKYANSEKGKLARQVRLETLRLRTKTRREVRSARESARAEAKKTNARRAVESANRAAEASVESYTRNKRQIRNSHLLRLYGIDIDGYEAILSRQGGVCAICKRTPEECGRELSVDHDHDTGDVRGLLCSTCNAGLGLFKDAVALVQAALDYLKKTKVAS